MRDYGKVSPQFWIGETGRRLRGHLEAQIVAAYLVTGPSAHPLGIYYLPIPTISHDTGLSIAGATKGLRRVIEGGFCQYDEPSSYVYVPEMARFQVAESMKPGDKRHGWAIGELIRIKIRRFVAEFVKKYGAQWQLDQGREYEALRRVIEGASIPHRSQEQEQEQETEADASGPHTVPLETLFDPESAETTTARARKEQRACRIPVDFALTDAMAAAIRNVGCKNPRAAFEHFRNLHAAKGSRFVDWQAAWRTWVGNHGKYACPCQRASPRGLDAVAQVAEEWAAEGRILA